MTSGRRNRIRPVIRLPNAIGQVVGTLRRCAEIPFHDKEPRMAAAQGAGESGFAGRLAPCYALKATTGDIMHHVPFGTPIVISDSAPPFSSGYGGFIISQGRRVIGGGPNTWKSICAWVPGYRDGTYAFDPLSDCRTKISNKLQYKHLVREYSWMRREIHLLSCAPDSRYGFSWFIPSLMELDAAPYMPLRHKQMLKALGRALRLIRTYTPDCSYLSYADHISVPSVGNNRPFKTQIVEEHILEDIHWGESEG